MKVLTALSLTACLVSSLLGTGCVAVDVGLGPTRHTELQEVTLREPDGLTSNRVLMLDITGTITHNSHGWLLKGRQRTPDMVSAMLRKAEKDKRVKAVIVRLETPGGGVTATDMIHHELREFRRRTDRPVVAVFMGTACSGGYYIASAAEKIYAHPTSVTGSIGVLAKFPQFGGLADKVGVDLLVIKSGKMKDLGNPLREMPKEERAVLQSLVDTFHATFLDRIIEGRSSFSNAPELLDIADGRVFTAQQALELGLVDRIAYLDEVIDDVVRDAGLRDARIVTYAYANNDEATLYTVPEVRGISHLGIAGASAGMILETLKPGFYYLWLPGSP